MISFFADVFVTVYEGKHKLIYICCVVPKVTSPPAQSYAIPNQCYTDKPLSQIFGSDPFSLRAKGTNAPSAATAWQTHSLPLWVQSERRLKTLQKNFPLKRQLKNIQHSTRMSHRRRQCVSAQISRAVDTLLLCSENNDPSESRKSFHFLLCFWCLWTLLPHLLSQVQSDLLLCLEFLGQWHHMLETACTKITRTSADQCIIHMWMGLADDAHLLVCNDLHCYTEASLWWCPVSQSNLTHTHTHTHMLVFMVYGDSP